MYKNAFLWRGIRKTASELLGMKFFRLAKNKDFIKEKIIKKLEPLDQRV